MIHSFPFNAPLCIAGVIAAWIIVLRFSTRKNFRAKLTDFFCTAAPGIVLAQGAYALACRKWPVILAEPIAAPVFGMFLSSAGLPVFLLLRDLYPRLIAKKLGQQFDEIQAAVPGELK